MSNPIFSDQPVLPINEIKEEHFIPALKEAIVRTRERFIEIRDNEDAPSFENTVVPFAELYGEMGRVFKAYKLFYNNIATISIKEKMTEIDQMDVEIRNEIKQDPILGARLNAVYGVKDTLGLDSEDLWLLEQTKKSFENTGALLPPAGQARINEIDMALAEKTAKINLNISEAPKHEAFLITDEALLEGVSDDKKSGFRDAAQKAGHDTGWLFTPERLLVDELLAVGQNREFRRMMHQSMDRVGKYGVHINTNLIKDVQALRDERAKLLGYDNFAQSVLDGRMAASVENVEQLFDDVSNALLPAFEKDMDTLQAWVSANNGPKLEPWDVQYYAARYRKEVLGYDAEEMTAYLALENVMDGWINHAQKQMNVTLTQKSDEYPTWNDDIRVYEVVDNQTQEKSVLYVDLFARSGEKSDGAWMSEIQSPSADGTQPNIIIMNMNLIKGEGNMLVSPEQVLTLYHEGGHALNGLLGVKTKYPNMQGTGNGSDYVEIHSMMSENWAFAPEVVRSYAKHYKTGKAVPQDLLDRKDKAEKFMASWDMLRLTQNARRDLILHSTDAADYIDDADIEEQAKLQSKYSEHTRPYPLTRFGHLFDGYAAGYYGYLWAEVKGNQAFDLFRDNGIYDPLSLRKTKDFFAIGHALEPNEAFEKKFGVKGLDVAPFLAKYGIEQNTSKPPANDQKPGDDNRYEIS